MAVQNGRVRRGAKPSGSMGEGCGILLLSSECQGADKASTFQETIRKFEGGDFHALSQGWQTAILKGEEGSTSLVSGLLFFDMNMRGVR